METDFENFGLVVLDENETEETNGGSHYEWIDGVLRLVDD